MKHTFTCTTVRQQTGKQMRSYDDCFLLNNIYILSQVDYNLLLYAS